MFENEQTFMGPKSIRMDTRLGRPIVNELRPALGPMDLARAALLRKRLGIGLNPRKDPAPYNCFGMAFAVRRTCIFDEDEVIKVLGDDGYTQIQEGEAKFGDLALFRTKRDGYIHVALVTRRDPDARILFVLSKWNDYSGEDEHSVYLPWWSQQGYRDDEVWTEYWTDR